MTANGTLMLPCLTICFSVSVGNEEVPEELMLSNNSRKKAEIYDVHFDNMKIAP